MPKKLLIEFNGKIAGVAEHCRDLGLKYENVMARHYRTGESYERCLKYYVENGTGLHNCIEIEFNGKIASIAEHCRDLCINPKTLASRKRRTGESDLECLEHYQKYGLQSKFKCRVKDKRLYRIWASTKQKCENPNHPSYKDYGGRGIKVCDRWQIYKNFENDLLDSYLNHVEKYGIKETTIDRWPNNDGDYEPNNVRWATYKEQMNNRRSNRMVTNELNATQIAEKYGINYSTVIDRLNKGWSAEEIINPTLRDKWRDIIPTGESLDELSKRIGVSRSTIIDRYNNGWDFQKIVETPLQTKIETPTGETIPQLAKRLGVSRQAIHQRLQRGQSWDKILNDLS